MLKGVMAPMIDDIWTMNSNDIDYLNSGRNLLKFCTKMASFDFPCFKTATKPTNRRYNSLWQVWDTNHDNRISDEEYEDALIKLDFDGNGHTSELEISAFLMRNKFLACRPVRNKVIKQIMIKLTNAMRPLFSILNPDGNNVMNATDIPLTMKTLDLNSDGEVDYEEITLKLDPVIETACDSIDYR